MSLLNSPSIKRVVFITKSLKKFIEKNYNYKNKNYLVLPDATDLIYKNKIKKKNLK